MFLIEVPTQEVQIRAMDGLDLIKTQGAGSTLKTLSAWVI
jgi:hypothetical protein